jgi:hypothetical protein
LHKILLSGKRIMPVDECHESAMSVPAIGIGRAGERPQRLNTDDFCSGYRFGYPWVCTSQSAEA